MYIHVSIYILYIGLHVYMYICIYTHTHTHIRLYMEVTIITAPWYYRRRYYDGEMIIAVDVITTVGHDLRDIRFVYHWMYSEGSDGDCRSFFITQTTGDKKQAVEKLPDCCGTCSVNGRVPSSCRRAAVTASSPAAAVSSGARLNMHKQCPADLSQCNMEPSWRSLPPY